LSGVEALGTSMACRCFEAFQRHYAIAAQNRTVSPRGKSYSPTLERDRDQKWKHLIVTVVAGLCGANIQGQSKLLPAEVSEPLPRFMPSLNSS